MGVQHRRKLGCRMRRRGSIFTPPWRGIGFLAITAVLAVSTVVNGNRGSPVEMGDGVGDVLSDAELSRAVDRLLALHRSSTTAREETVEVVAAVTAQQRKNKKKSQQLGTQGALSGTTPPALQVEAGRLDPSGPLIEELWQASSLAQDDARLSQLFCDGTAQQLGSALEIETQLDPAEHARNQILLLALLEEHRCEVVEVLETLADQMRRLQDRTRHQNQIFQMEYEIAEAAREFAYAAMVRHTARFNALSSPADIPILSVDASGPANITATRHTGNDDDSEGLWQSAELLHRAVNVYRDSTVHLQDITTRSAGRRVALKSERGFVAQAYTGYQNLKTELDTHIEELTQQMKTQRASDVAHAFRRRLAGFAAGLQTVCGFSAEMSLSSIRSHDHLRCLVRRPDGAGAAYKGAATSAGACGLQSSHDSLEGLGSPAQCSRLVLLINGELASSCTSLLSLPSLAYKRCRHHLRSTMHLSLGGGPQDMENNVDSTCHALAATFKLRALAMGSNETVMGDLEDAASFCTLMRRIQGRGAPLNRSMPEGQCPPVSLPSMDDDTTGCTLWNNGCGPVNEMATDTNSTATSTPTSACERQVQDCVPWALGLEMSLRAYVKARTADGIAATGIDGVGSPGGHTCGGQQRMHAAHSGQHSEMLSRLGLSTMVLASLPRRAYEECALSYSCANSSDLPRRKALCLQVERLYAERAVLAKVQDGGISSTLFSRDVLDQEGAIKFCTALVSESSLGGYGKDAHKPVELASLDAPLLNVDAIMGGIPSAQLAEDPSCDSGKAIEHTVDARRHPQRLQLPVCAARSS